MSTAGGSVRRGGAQQFGPKVGIIMGSVSDWETMSHAAATLDGLGVAFETRVVSAHRTPDLLFEYASKAEERGLEVIIAGAGGAAHLPGMTAAKTLLPVLGVPVESKVLRGVDSLLSIVQMPAGVPVATFAIGKAGAINAALFAAQILARRDGSTRAALARHRDAQTQSVLDRPDPRVPPDAEESAPGSLSTPDSNRRGAAAAAAADADVEKGAKT
jgi:5-(carboxyamino)imidazole ribonucleotide mutase